MISPDLPITKSSDDKLNRSSFAKSLAQVLVQYTQPSSFTIGLYGEWGSGKTSLVNMILETVESIDNSAVIVRFNPWLCSEPKQLITQFFKQMASAIKMKQPTPDRVWELIDQYADIFDAASLIPGVGTLVTAGGKTLATKAKRRVEARAQDLQGRKDVIVKKLNEKHLKIIVAIDDIDRLSEEEIIAVFQVVKALADFPNTVYLLAFDYEVVIRALSKVQHGDGKEYLEKVIQVPFEIPTPNMSSIQNALFSKLNMILGDIPEDGWDKATWSELYQFGLKRYIKSIRDVVRFSNVFFLKYELLKNETDPVDLLGLTCLQVFEPSVYSRIPIYKDTLCGTNQSYSYERQKIEEDKVQSSINALVPDNGTIVDKEASKNILGILFPRTRSATGMSYSMGRQYVYRNFFIRNNIAVPACFDRYFSLMLEDNAIPTTVVKHLIYEANENELQDGMKQLYHDGKIIRLLEEIEAYANKGNCDNIASNRAILIIKCLARQWACFEVDDTGFFSVPFAWRLLFCIDPLLNSLDPSLRYPCLQSVFEDYDVQPSTLAILLHDFENQLGRFTDKETTGDNAVIKLDEVLELESIFKKRAVEVLESGIFLEQHEGLNFLWLLEQIDAELVKRKKTEIVKDDISLIKVISYCTSHGTTAARTVSKVWQINKDLLKEFIDLAEAERRVRTFIDTEQFLKISENEQMDAIAFLISLKSENKQSILDSHIGEESIRKKLRELIERHNS